MNNASQLVRTVVLATVFVGLSVAMFFGYRPTPHTGIDYLHFWAMPRVVKRFPQASIYEKAAHPEMFKWIQSHSQEANNPHLINLIDKNSNLYVDGIDPTGTPFLYSVFGLPQIGNFEIDYCVYQLISNFVFIAGVFLLGRTVGLSPLWCIGMLFFFLLTSASLIVDYSVANTNRIQVGLIGFAFWLFVTSPERDNEWLKTLGVVVGAMLMGMLIAFKPNIILAPVLLILACLFDRQFRTATFLSVGCALGLSIAVMVGALWFGSIDCWFEWRDYAKQIVDKPFPMESGNSTFLALVNPGWIPAISLVVTGSLFGLIVVTSYLTRATSDLGDSLRNDRGRLVRCVLIASVGLLIPLLSSPVAWSHYFLMTLPCVVLTIGGFRKFMITQFSGRVFVAGWIIATILVNAIPITQFRIADPNWITAILSSGVLLLIVVAILALWKNSTMTKTAIQQ